MPSASWTNEHKLAGGWQYNDSRINYNQATLTIDTETFDLYYNTTGLETTWTNESV